MIVFALFSGPILEKHSVSSFVRMIASVNKKENS
uniref:Transcriptional regulator n=1 Tax=Ascaris lumbricoides TaxID=6252 RepID=A0A0M3HLA9_ASCLU